MPLCYIFATYRLYRLYTQSALYFCIPINLIYFMLGCSMYLQIHTVCTYALLKYNTQLILYTYLQCSIYIASPLPIYSLHSLHPTHTTCVYTPCKLHVLRTSIIDSCRNTAHVGQLLLGTPPLGRTGRGTIWLGGGV